MQRTAKKKRKNVDHSSEKAEENSLFIRLVCIATAIVLICGIITIGAMNLLCTDELYTTYNTAFSVVTAVTGAAVLAAAILVSITVYGVSRHNKAYITILVLAFCFRILAALFWKIEPDSDFKITYELGKLIAHTPLTEWGKALDNYGTNYNSTWAVHMPFVVYQSFLLRLWNDASVLRITNALFSFGSCLLISETAGVIGGQKAKRIALTFTAFNPTIIFFIPVLTNQHISQFFLMLGVWSFMSERISNIHIRAWIAGLCFGISQLMRPDITLIIAAIVVYLIFSCIRNGNAAYKITVFAAFICVFLAVIAAMNTFLVSSHVIHGNIYLGNLNYKIMVGLNPDTNGSWSASDSGLEGNVEAINTMIKARLTVNPLKLIPRLFGKAVYQLGSYVYTWSFRSESEWISQIIMRRGGTALMLIVSALAAWNMLFKRQHKLIIMYMVTAVFAAVYAVIEVQSRYNFIVIPILIIIASANFTERNKING